MYQAQYSSKSILQSTRFELLRIHLARLKVLNYSFLYPTASFYQHHLATLQELQSWCKMLDNLFGITLAHLQQFNI
jgi:hypothetical protein